jgi:biopolymer transport protein ExbB
MTEHLTYIAAATNPLGLKTAWEFLEKGGIFMIPLGLTSIVGTMTIIYKALSLAKSRVIPEGLEQDVMRLTEQLASGTAIQLLNQLEKGRSTLARLCTVVIQNKDRNSAQITTAVEAKAREEVLILHSGISVLDTIITIAPLLGLLGTASGLVTIFQGLGDNADNLAIARGIAEALTTTIFGLAIAVPCVVAHGYFIRRIELLTARMESLLNELTHAFEKPSSTL